MARKANKRDVRYLATLVTGEKSPCAFCHREVDDEAIYGKLYAIGSIQCHYFCVLLSCCLVQKGHEEDGLFGFMYKDILAELERSKKHKCSFCGREGASLGCSVGACRKQFHLPCGRERNAVSLYYGTYKSFCQVHAPKQKIPEHIMCKAKLRMKSDRKVKSIKEINQENGQDEEMVCVICYEAVDAFPTVNTFWPPCCARDAWFHRSCLQRMALSAGMHYLKCPLCNDKGNFYDAVLGQGYYVPDRDAAWELEQNAFAEIYERSLTCTADQCQCPLGRGHDADQGMWDIKLCLLCGSVGAHAHCIGASETTRYICLTCTPVAPDDIQTLANTIEDLILQEQANTNTVCRGPVMPSRMSLRRTKGRLAVNAPSCSKSLDTRTECESAVLSPNLRSSRQELNLKTPRKHIHEDKQTNIQDSYDNKLNSPTKLLEQSFREKVLVMGVKDAVLDETVLDVLRRKFRKPRPLSEKKKIVEDILDGLFDNLNHKTKNPIREWGSPKKCLDIIEEAKVSEPSSEKFNISKSQNEVKNKLNNSKSLTEDKDKLNISKYENEDKDNLRTPKRSTRWSNSLKIDTPNSSRVQYETDTIVKQQFIKIGEKNHIINGIEDTEPSNNNEAQKISEVNEKNIEEIQNQIMDISELNNNDEIIGNKHDDSTSTVQTPELNNDNFISFITPKRKTVDIKQDSSLEISELDQSISIDVIKIEDSLKTEDIKPLKFSPHDKENLEKVKIDLESFKKCYLTEVDREFKINQNLEQDVNSFKKEVPEKRGLKRNYMDGGLVLKFGSDKRRKLSENTDFKSNAKEINENVEGKVTIVQEIQKGNGDNKNEMNSESEKDVVELNKNGQGRKMRRESKKDKRIKRDSDKDKRHKRVKETHNTEKLKSKENVSKRDKDVNKENGVNENNKINKEKHENKRKDKHRHDKYSAKRDKRTDKYSAKRDKRTDKYSAKRDKSTDKRDIRSEHDIQSGNDIDITIDSSKRKNKKKTKNKTKLSIRNSEKDISVKIKWKKKQLRLKIESKKEKNPKDSKYKQYVLQYFAEVSPTEVLVKPEKEISPIKRKYIKQEKSPDKLKQMSIQNFFKTKSPSDK